MNTPLKKAAAILLIASSIFSTSCGPRVPSRTGTTNDSLGGTSHDTAFQQRSGTLKGTTQQRIPAATNDSLGGTSHDTALIRQ
jgi:hypothetical protein